MPSGKTNTSLHKRIINIDDHSAWKAALDGLPHAVAHTAPYQAALSLTTGYDPKLVVISDDEFKAVTVIAVREYLGFPDAVSPYGNGGFAFVGTPRDIMPTFIDLLNEHNFVAAYLNSSQVFDDLPLFGSATLEDRNEMFVLDLSRSEEDLYQTIGKNNRRHLRRWHEGSATLVFDQARLRTSLLQMYPIFAERKEVASQYRFTNDTLSAILDLECCVLIGAEEENGSITAIRCFIKTPFVVDAFLEAHIENGQQHSRPMYWEAMKRFGAEGVPILNMGGGITKGDSLAFFKKSFGTAGRRQLSAKIIIDQNRYKDLCEKSGFLQTETHYFPAYHMSRHDNEK